MLEHMMVAQESPREQPDWHLAFEFYPLHGTARTTKIRASVETALGLFLNDVLPGRMRKRCRHIIDVSSPANAVAPPPAADPSSLSPTHSAVGSRERRTTHDARR
jgi:hypothetical protein